MATNLADPYLKTARAKEHLEDLRERLRSFREADPCSFRREDDLERQLHIITIKIKQIPDKLPLVVGDFLYCVRSALDQLVWALAKNPGSYPKGTQFPIFETDYRRDKFLQYTAGIHPDAFAIIEDLQPYKGRDQAEVKSHLLYRLNLLCNIDKHRRIPTDATALDFNFPHFPRKFLPSVSFDHDAQMVIAPLRLKQYMALDPTGAIEVFFGDSFEGVRCNFDGLEQIHNFVTNVVIPRFARFF
jgi:hypothetical protein